MVNFIVHLAISSKMAPNMVRALLTKVGWAPVSSTMLSPLHTSAQQQALSSALWTLCHMLLNPHHVCSALLHMYPVGFIASLWCYSQFTGETAEVQVDYLINPRSCSYRYYNWTSNSSFLGLCKLVLQRTSLKYPIELCRIIKLSCSQHSSCTGKFQSCFIILLLHGLQQ